jgi:hypothetical protein
MSDWQPMETAPRNGTAIQAKIPGHGSDNIIAWEDGLLDSDGGHCGGWSFAESQEPPDDWTDGICWEVNEDGKRSTEPTAWKRLRSQRGG